VTAADTFAYPLVSLSRIAPRILEPMRAAQRRSSDPVAASRAFPAAECNSVTAVTQVVCNSDAIMVVNLSCIARELEHRELVVLGSEPWLFLGYGLVRLKGQPMTALAGAFREFVLAAERATVLEEESLIARWTPGAAGAGTRRRAARPHRKFRRARAG
jgi:DNA-binding transcriptional LysR family regulator